MKQAQSDRIMAGLRRHYGVPRPDLAFVDRYQLTVAVILSAQTTDRQVNQATPPLFERYPDFAALSRARVADVARIVRSTGFFNTKARNITTMARMVMKEFSGILPKTREELMRLPGVGRKSANVILSIGFGIPALAVDTHLTRIANRLAYCDTNDPLRVEEALTALIPEERWTETHQILIRHGRTLCMARNPRCGECPINSECAAAERFR